MSVNKEKLHTCVYCRNNFTEAPAEHILQNCLSATLTDGKIMCAECQKHFGAMPDVEAGKFSQFFRNILNVGTDRRRDNVPTLKNAKDKEGHSYVLKPGFVPELREPYYSVEDGAVKLVFSQKNKYQEAWVKKKVEQDGIRLGEEIVREMDSCGTGPISLQMGYNFGFLCVAMLKSALNLIGHINPSIALNTCLDKLRNDLIELKTEECIARIKCPSLIPFPDEQYAPFAHQLFVYSKNTKIEAMLRMFGGVSFVMRLAEGYSGESFVFKYLDDPNGKVKRVVENECSDIIASCVNYDECDASYSHKEFYKNYGLGYSLFLNKHIAHNEILSWLAVQDEEAHIFFKLLFPRIYPFIISQIYYETNYGSPDRVRAFTNAALGRIDAAVLTLKQLQELNQ